MKRLVWLLSLTLLVPSLSGCGCEAILRIHRDPDTVTVAVGETAPPPRISTSGCYELPRAVEILEWRSEDPEIALVDPNTGVITGVAPGEMVSIGYAQGNQTGAYTVPVTVVAATTAAR
jgi:hypothetical protein